MTIAKACGRQLRFGRVHFACGGFEHGNHKQRPFLDFAHDSRCDCGLNFEQQPLTLQDQHLELRRAGVTAAIYHLGYVAET